MSLPPELLRLICRHATAPSPTCSQLDTEPNCLVASTKWPQIPPPDPTSSHTKVALALVSRQFWYIAFEFLYEALYIKCADSSRSLAAIWSRVTDGESQAGRWTRSISVDIPNSMPTELSDMARDLAIIFKQCQNLQMVSVQVSDSSISGWREFELAILPAIPSGISHLEWTCGGSGWANAAAEFPALLKRTRALRVLRLKGLVPRQQDHLSKSLPDLTHLEFLHGPAYRNDLRLFHRWELPSLTQLSLVSMVSDNATSLFWDIPKPTLTTLCLGESVVLSPSFARRVLAAVPNLRNLTYHHLTHWGDTWIGAAHPALSHIGIRIFHPSQQSVFERPYVELDHCWRGFRGHLRPFCGPGFPSLKTLTLGDRVRAMRSIPALVLDPLIHLATEEVVSAGIVVNF